MEKQEATITDSGYLKEGYRPANIQELITVIDSTEYEYLKSQIREIVSKDNLDNVVIYTDEENQIQQIQMWSEHIVYIAYDCVLKGLVFTCALRNPPKS